MGLEAIWYLVFTVKEMQLLKFERKIVQYNSDTILIVKLTKVIIKEMD